MKVGTLNSRKGLPLKKQLWKTTFAVIAFGLASLSTQAISANIYDLSFTTMQNKEKKLSDYKGKTLLIVNTASKCGYTSQYEDLEKLYKKYKAKGLVVLGFPSTSFNQEYTDNKKVADFCKLKFGVTFPLAKVGKVIGKDSNKVFSYLIENSPSSKGQNVSWNFEKFVVGPTGKVVGRFKSSVNPMDQKVVSLVEKNLK